MSLLQKPVTRRALVIGCCLWLAFLLIPLIVLCFYTYPAYDDITHIRPAAVAWAKSGSLWQTLQAAWNHTAVMYQTWQGTFTAMFFSSLQPMLFSTRLYFLTPLSMIAGLCLSAAFFCVQTAKLAKLPRFSGFILFTLLITLITGYAPGLRESLYWLSGCPYLLGIILFLLLGGCLMMSLQAKLSKAQRIRLGIAALLLGVLAGGCPYPAALGTTVACGCFCFWSLLRRKAGRLVALLAFLGVLGALVTVVAAPGNAIRQAKCGEPMNPVSALVYSFAQCLQETGKWFSPQLAAVALLSAILFLKPLSESALSFHNPFWFSFFSFGIITAAFVPPIYATGPESYLVERVLSSLYLFYTPVLLLNILYWSGWLAQKCNAHNFKLPKPALPVWSVLTAVFLLGWGMFAQGILAAPPVSAALSVADGSAAAYHQQLIARETAFQTEDGYYAAAARVVPLSAQPGLLYEDRLPAQLAMNPHAAREIVQLCCLQKEAQNYGAGRIPQEKLAYADSLLDRN